MKFLEKRKNFLFSLLSGILLALSFPPLPFPFLAFVGFVPILYIVLQKSEVRYKYLLVYFTFFIYHTSSNWWISSWRAETDPFLLITGLGLDIIHPLFFLFPFWLFFYVKRKLGDSIALAAFPFIFLLFEWLHSLGDLAYPWLTFGNTQISNLYWIQFIDITGIWGASFLIFCVNALILSFIKGFANSSDRKLTAYLIREKSAGYKIILIAIFIFLPYFYSFNALQYYNYTENLKNNKNITIGIVQPNINPWLKWQESPIQQILLHQRISDSLIKKQSNMDLLLWSETAVPFLHTSFNSFNEMSLLTNWIDKTNVPLLTGFAEFEFIPKEAKKPQWAKHFETDPKIYYMTYNASVLLEPNKYYSEIKRPQTYRKSKLTPFGEHFPFKNVFPWLAEKLMWGVGISNWNIGSGADILSLELNGRKAKIGSIICIESIHPNFVRDYVLKGANIFTVTTNDGWYDFTPGPRQHYLLSCIRAIENRRYIARVGNTGVSGFISPLGNSLVEIDQYKVSAKSAILPLLENKTIYALWGDWFAWIISGIAVFIILISIIAKKELEK